MKTWRQPSKVCLWEWACQKSSNASVDRLWSFNQANKPVLWSNNRQRLDWEQRPLFQRSTWNQRERTNIEVTDLDGSNANRKPWDRWIRHQRSAKRWSLFGCRSSRERATNLLEWNILQSIVEVHLSRSVELSVNKLMRTWTGHQFTYVRRRPRVFQLEQISKKSTRQSDDHFDEIRQRAEQTDFFHLETKCFEKRRLIGQQEIKCPAAPEMSQTYWPNGQRTKNRSPRNVFSRALLILVFGVRQTLFDVNQFFFRDSRMISRLFVDQTEINQRPNQTEQS